MDFSERTKAFICSGYFGYHNIIESKCCSEKVEDTLRISTLSFGLKESLC